MFDLNNPWFLILTIFVVVIIAAYNFHTIDVTLQYEPSSVNIVDKVKSGRFAMVYPTMKGTPFIEIPTSRSDVQEGTQTGGNGTSTTSSSAVPSSILNRLNSATTQQ